MNFIESNLNRPFKIKNDKYDSYYFYKTEAFGFYAVMKVEGVTKTKTVEGVVDDSSITDQSFRMHKTILGEVAYATIDVNSITFIGEKEVAA